MAIYQGYQSVLNVALGAYQGKGFRLLEPDDHILELYYEDSLVARFLQSRATILMIRRTCEDYLAERSELATG